MNKGTKIPKTYRDAEDLLLVKKGLLRAGLDIPKRTFQVNSPKMDLSRDSSADGRSTNSNPATGKAENEKEPDSPALRPAFKTLQTICYSTKDSSDENESSETKTGGFNERFGTKRLPLKSLEEGYTTPDGPSSPQLLPLHLSNSKKSQFCKAAEGGAEIAVVEQKKVGGLMFNALSRESSNPRKPGSKPSSIVNSPLIRSPMCDSPAVGTPINHKAQKPAPVSFSWEISKEDAVTTEAKPTEAASPVNPTNLHIQLISMESTPTTTEFTTPTTSNGGSITNLTPIGGTRLPNGAITALPLIHSPQMTFLRGKDSNSQVLTQPNKYHLERIDKMSLDHSHHVTPQALKDLLAKKIQESENPNTLIHSAVHSTTKPIVALDFTKKMIDPALNYNVDRLKYIHEKKQAELNLSLNANSESLANKRMNPIQMAQRKLGALQVPRPNQAVITEINNENAPSATKIKKDLEGQNSGTPTAMGPDHSSTNSASAHQRVVNSATLKRPAQEQEKTDAVKKEEKKSEENKEDATAAETTKRRLVRSSSVKASSAMKMLASLDEVTKEKPKLTVTVETVEPGSRNKRNDEESKSPRQRKSPGKGKCYSCFQVLILFSPRA